MNLLYYNELDYKKVEKNFKKIEEFLLKDNFKSAEVKKLQNTRYYRAKLDKEDRLLFKYARYEGKMYILLLEVILNHEYEKSKFLNGAKIDETKIIDILQPENIPTEDVKDLIYLNKQHKHFYLLDKILSFDDYQAEVYELPTPLIIIGSAGSGKTVLTLEKMKQLHGNIAYISLSPFLIENAQKIYYSNNYDNPHQEVDFLSFKEYIESLHAPQGKEITYKQFYYWFNKHFTNFKIKESHRLYEEFKGVLTGSVTDKPCLSRQEYKELGVKQSVFSKADRDLVYDVFERYLQFLKESNHYDINIISFEYLTKTEKVYDFIVVDEVQDFTNIQLKLVLSSLKSTTGFIFSGDSNQIVHPNFFSWSKIKSMFYLDDLPATLMRVLTTNYRNSKEITDLSNRLLKIKNARFGSIDKESTFLIDSVSTVTGEVKLLTDDKKMKNQLNQKTQNSTKFAVLVMNNEDKARAKEFFTTPLVFSVQEAKGLEYENIILLNFVSEYADEFQEITHGVNASILDDELKYSRAKNKEDKDLEIYKFFVNSLYVALTRAVKNIYIIENNHHHRLFSLLKLKQAEQKIEIETQKSTAEEWLQEARKLELQGKHEQAQQIRDRIHGIQYLSPEQYEELKQRALDPEKTENEVKRERKDLYQYAVARKQYNDIKALADLKFLRAVAYMQEYKMAQKEFAKNCRLDRFELLNRIIKNYDVDFRSNENDMTGLMLGCNYGAEKTIEFFLQHEANNKLRDADGLQPFQIAMKSYIFDKLKLTQQHTWMKIDLLAKFYNQLAPLYMKCNTGNRILKLGSHTMEYYLISCLCILRSEKKESSFQMDDFVSFTEEIPNLILPEYRKKRSYINSILANNEVDRIFIYNKFLFKRKGRGSYILNPDLQFIDDEM
jgi:ankyrin repeat protein